MQYEVNHGTIRSGYGTRTGWYVCITDRDIKSPIDSNGKPIWSKPTQYNYPISHKEAWSEINAILECVGMQTELATA